jgi:hypothetical protein
MIVMYPNYISSLVVPNNPIGKGLVHSLVEDPGVVFISPIVVLDKKNGT